MLALGGTILRPDNNWFRIVKALGFGGNLFSCPDPSSPLDQCQPVGQVSQDGKNHLALVKDYPFGFYFEKA
ncbi:hypothetical protein FXO38_04896 [Capsicum annuum]|uniref:Uncharacterized protein n=1 Tax=Capsicum annuum TaxID=4072 RepID=A0A2G2Y8N4_CAPAN|nr:hypothetical protein FXO37_23393 [Capsicum annuum]KAF3675104.1 hypothetical protein FXO38_04896 [Capsicum annuum]PHT66092.1 hypothetical protein T459_30517 [Capsicum annuum]